MGFTEKPERGCDIQYSFYYLLTMPYSIEDDLVDESIRQGDTKGVRT
jgi:hypothetical protein